MRMSLMIVSLRPGRPGVKQNPYADDGGNYPTNLLRNTTCAFGRAGREQPRT
jgi:hypothetical protein